MTAAYSTKFMAESLAAHLDFQVAGTWTMDLLSAGTNDIVSEAGVTIASATTETVISASNTNVTLTYTVGTSYISDIYYQTSDQAISVVDKNTVQILPYLPCSSGGSTSITFSIADYNGVVAPTWTTIDSTTGQLNISAPDVSSDSVYSFYIKSNS